MLIGFISPWSTLFISTFIDVAVSSRRRTLERQSSVNQLLSANEVATSSKTFKLSDHTKSASLSSVQSSPDRASGVQGTSLQSCDSQDVSQGASLDKFDSVTSGRKTY